MKLFNGKQEENPWISISDLMSVLMMVFLFVSITYMVKITIEKKRIETIAVTYENLQNELYLDLKKEFGKNLKDWNAVLDESTLSIRFEQPDILFEVGSAELKNNFKALLDDFFPRYLNILTSDKYKNDIEEIRIEGHTSSEWFSKTSEQQAYFNNMELSQNRTRKVLEYILRQDWNKNLFEWEKKHLTANGLSSSKLIFDADGQENKEKSRRVEFRVKTDAEKRIVRILKQDKT